MTCSGLKASRIAFERKYEPPHRPKWVQSMLKEGSLWLPRLSWFQDSKENKTRIETQTFFQPVEQTYTPKNDISSGPSINFQKIRHVFQGGYLKKKNNSHPESFKKTFKKNTCWKKKQKNCRGFHNSRQFPSFQVHLGLSTHFRVEVIVNASSLVHSATGICARKASTAKGGFLRGWYMWCDRFVFLEGK